MEHANESLGRCAPEALIDVSLTAETDRKNSPNASKKQALNARRWLLRNAISEHGALLESLGIGIGEATWRGDDRTVATHVKQARLVVIAAIQTVNDLAALDGEAGQ